MKYDIVLLSNILHFIDHSKAELVIDMCYSMLNEKGLIGVTVLNDTQRDYPMPNLYNQESFNQMKNKFEIIKEHPTWLNFSFIDGNKPNQNKYEIYCLFLASLSVALILFYLNILKDEKKRKKEKIEKLRGEIYFLCEKVIAYAVHSSQRALEARYYYSMHKANRDEDFDKGNYMKYLNDSENSSLLVTINKAELISKLIELESFYDNINEMNRIKELMYKTGNNLVKTYGGVFNPSMVESEIENKRDIEMARVESYVRNDSMGKNIIEIQKIINPSSK